MLALLKKNNNNSINKEKLPLRHVIEMPTVSSLCTVIDCLCVRVCE
jgi:hypothetical protein